MRLIDADELVNLLENNLQSFEEMISEHGKGIAHGTRIALGLVKEQPTISLENPQPQWIPVTEKLPENEGDFIVTANDSITGLFVVKDHCYKGTDGKMQFLNQIDGNLYHNHDGELKRHTRNITAWMPLPEPYKPEKIEDNDD